MSAATSPRLTAPELFGYRKYWAHRLTPAPFLPMSREEMDELGWDQCDVILVTGDAYVDQLLAAVPEPSMVGLAVLAPTLLARRRRAARA